MALQQNLAPLNSEIMDSLVHGADTRWVPTGDNAWIKVLWTGSESGRWAALFRWNKGYVADAHKHLSAAHTFVLKGRLEIRGGVLEAGDYVYEANGMLHEKTTALEDTEYLFICDGPVLFYNDDGLTHYIGWEQMRGLQQAGAAT